MNPTMNGLENAAMDMSGRSAMRLRARGDEVARSAAGGTVACVGTLEHPLSLPLQAATCGWSGRPLPSERSAGDQGMTNVLETTRFFLIISLTGNGL